MTEEEEGKPAATTTTAAAIRAAAKSGRARRSPETAGVLWEPLASPGDEKMPLGGRCSLSRALKYELESDNCR